MNPTNTTSLALLPVVEVAFDVALRTIDAIHPDNPANPSHIDELAITIVHQANALRIALRCYRRAIDARRVRLPGQQP